MQKDEEGRGGKKEKEEEKEGEKEGGKEGQGSRRVAP